jgi:hypothetical protein
MFDRKNLRYVISEGQEAARLRHSHEQRQQPVPWRERPRDLTASAISSAAIDPAGFGLDDTCAQLEGSTYVMAEEPRRIVSY